MSGSRETGGMVVAVSASATASLQRGRLVLHLGFCFVPLLYWKTDLTRWALVALCLPAVVGIAFDLYRIRSPETNAFVFAQWGHLLKEPEQARLTGSSHYFLGILGAVLIFAKPVAVCSSLYMAWADPAALLIGRWIGRRPAGRKTWEGFGAFVAVAFLIGLAFFSWTAALLGAVAAGLIECFTPRWANDNSLVPIGAGLVLSLIT